MVHATQPEPAIDLQRVEKIYRGSLGRRSVHALRDASLRVERGEVFGLLGPNGAGKSTLVKVLMTVIAPTACEGRMLGSPVGDKSALARVGYLPEHHRFPDYLTGRQVLDFYAALAKVPRPERRRREGELLELVGMTKDADRRVRGYSKGMKQRIGVAQALMNDPHLVLLDEPTDGVDPAGRRDIRQILQELKRRGKTVFLNSHLLTEMEMVCDRVAIMVQGRVHAQGTLDELTAADRRYEIELAPPAAGPAPSEDTIRSALGRAGGPLAGDRLASGEAVAITGSLIRVESTDPHRVQPIIDALRAAGLVVRSVRPFRPTLEDLFMKAVTDPSTGRVLPPGSAADAPGQPSHGGPR